MATKNTKSTSKTSTKKVVKNINKSAIKNVIKHQKENVDILGDVLNIVKHRTEAFSVLKTEKNLLDILNSARNINQIALNDELRFKEILVNAGYSDSSVKADSAATPGVKYNNLKELSKAVKKAYKSKDKTDLYLKMAIDVVKKQELAYKSLEDVTMANCLDAYNDIREKQNLTDVTANDEVDLTQLKIASDKNAEVSANMEKFEDFNDFLKFIKMNFFIKVDFQEINETYKTDSGSKLILNSNLITREEKDEQKYLHGSLVATANILKGVAEISSAPSKVKLGDYLLKYASSEQLSYPIYKQYLNKSERENTEYLFDETVNYLVAQNLALVSLPTQLNKPVIESLNYNASINLAKLAETMPTGAVARCISQAVADRTAECYYKMQMSEKDIIAKYEDNGIIFENKSAIKTADDIVFGKKSYKDFSNSNVESNLPQLTPEMQKQIEIARNSLPSYVLTVDEIRETEYYKLRLQLYKEGYILSADDKVVGVNEEIRSRFINETNSQTQAKTDVDEEFSTGSANEEVATESENNLEFCTEALNELEPIQRSLNKFYTNVNANGNSILKTNDYKYVVPLVDGVARADATSQSVKTVKEIIKSYTETEKEKMNFATVNSNKVNDEEAQKAAIQKTINKLFLEKLTEDVRENWLLYRNAQIKYKDKTSKKSVYHKNQLAIKRQILGELLAALLNHNKQIARKNADSNENSILTNAEKLLLTIKDGYLVELNNYLTDEISKRLKTQNLQDVRLTKASVENVITDILKSGSVSLEEASTKAYARSTENWNKYFVEKQNLTEEEKLKGYSHKQIYEAKYIRDSQLLKKDLLKFVIDLSVDAECNKLLTSQVKNLTYDITKDSQIANANKVIKLIEDGRSKTMWVEKPIKASHNVSHSNFSEEIKYQDESILNNQPNQEEDKFNYEIGESNEHFTYEVQQNINDIESVEEELNANVALQMGLTKEILSIKDFISQTQNEEELANLQAVLQEKKEEYSLIEQKTLDLNLSLTQKHAYLEELLTKEKNEQELDENYSAPELVNEK